MSYIANLSLKLNEHEEFILRLSEETRKSEQRAQILEQKMQGLEESQKHLDKALRDQRTEFDRILKKQQADFEEQKEAMNREFIAQQVYYFKQTQVFKEMLESEKGRWEEEHRNQLSQRDEDFSGKLSLLRSDIQQALAKSLQLPRPTVDLLEKDVKNATQQLHRLQRKVDELKQSWETLQEAVGAYPDGSIPQLS
jgi:hypothetical protein